jgi:hypothetical protein
MIRHACPFVTPLDDDPPVIASERVGADCAFLPSGLQAGEYWVSVAGMVSPVTAGGIHTALRFLLDHFQTDWAFNLLLATQPVRAAASLVYFHRRGVVVRNSRKERRR